MKRGPTIIDVARVAGVSTATVSRVINQDSSVKAKTKQTVEDTILTLGYRRNSLARGLVTGKTGVIGVLIPDVTGPLYAQMARGIEDVLMPLGIHFMTVSDNRDPVEEKNAIELLLERQVDALIIIGSYLSDAELKKLAGKTRLILVQREIQEKNSCFTRLQLNNKTGVLEALEYFKALGHTKIAHVSGVRFDGALRKQLFQQTLLDWGFEPLIIESDGDEASGREAAKRLPKDITAVFCNNDRTAVGFYHGLKECGLRIPEDVSVIGFDDLPWVQYLDPPLTTIKQPARLMGQKAARYALELPDPSFELFSTQLVKRNSVAPFSKVLS